MSKPIATFFWLCFWILFGFTYMGEFNILVSAYGDDVRVTDMLTPQPSGQSILARLYQQKAPAVVYMTGINVNPVKQSPDEYFVPAPKVKEERSVGTGFIIHEDGYIITNTHAVLESLMPEVEFYDGRRLGAEIIALVPEEDLALLKVDSMEKLSTIEVEPNPEVTPGDTIVTIGCPHALKHTMSYGIISATNRTSVVTDIEGLVLKGLLQTDAAINPGNSGGPWLNLYGRLIGVTVSKRGDSDNIAFGISLETLHYQLPLMLHRAVRKRWQLPFRVTGTRKNVQYRARLCELEPEFAKRWRLEENDVILGVNGREIRNPIDFYLALLSQETGDRVELTVTRQPQNFTTQQIAQFYENVPKTEENAVIPKQEWNAQTVFRCDFKLEPRKEDDVMEKIFRRLPLRVRALTKEEIERYNLRVPAGLMIEETKAERFKHLKHGPKAGDILASVNYQRPKTPEQLAEILENISGKTPFHIVVLRLDEKDGKEINTRIDIKNWK